MTQRDTLRTKWDRSEETLGAWTFIPSPVTAESCARAGFDYVCIDTQHGAIGYDSVARYTAVRVQTVQVIHAIEPLHHDAARELRAADSSVAPTLNELAERLRVLDEMARRMPGTSAAENAQQASRAVSQQLDRGSAAYDVLLAAAARLLAEPDIDRPVSDVLEPAASALIAYAHGLQAASNI